jgi:hypothetical protein
MVLQLDLRVGVLMDAKNNGTRGNEGLDRFEPPCGQKYYVLCVLVYYDCLGSRPPLPLVL